MKSAKQLIEQVMNGSSARHVVNAATEGAVGKLDLSAIASEMNKYPGSKILDQGEDGVLVKLGSSSDAQAFKNAMTRKNMDCVTKGDAVLCRPVGGKNAPASAGWQ